MPYKICEYKEIILSNYRLPHWSPIVNQNLFDRRGNRMVRGTPSSMTGCSIQPPPQQASSTPTVSLLQ